MSKTINHHLKKWAVRILIALVVIFLIVMLIPGCGSEANKLQKAENRVLANVESVKRVRATTADLFPCSNDTVTTHIHDTTINKIIKTIHHTDTLVKEGIKYISLIDTAFFEKTKTIYQDKIVTDHELTNRQKDTINELRLREAAFSGTIAEVRTNLSIEHKSSNKKTLYIWLIIAGAIASHILRSYIGGWFGSIFGMFKKK